MSKNIFKHFHHLLDPLFLFIHTKRYGNIPTGIAITTAPNAGGLGENRDSRRISGYRIDNCCSAINNN